MAKPRVTVCIPAARSSELVAETLWSVQEQTYTDFQVEIAVEPNGEGLLWTSCAHTCPTLASASFAIL